MCENAMENLMKRVCSCKRSCGEHMNDIVFLLLMTNLPLLNEIKIK